MSVNQDKEKEFEKFLDHQIKQISEYSEGEEMFKENIRKKLNKLCQINILNKEWLKKWKEIVCYEQVKEKCKKFNNSETKDNNLRKEIGDLFKNNNSQEELKKLGKMEFPNNIKGKTSNEKGNNILFNEENINFIPVISNYCNYLRSNIENIFVSGNFNKGKCFLYNQIKDKKKKVLILEQKKDNNDEFDALMITLGEKEDIKSFINGVKNKTFDELMNDKNLKLVKREISQNKVNEIIKNNKEEEKKKKEEEDKKKKEEEEKKKKEEEEKKKKEEEEVEEVEEEEEEEDIVGEDFSKDPRAFSYLQDAGRIADEVLKFTLEKCKPSANIYEICQASDNLIKEKLSKIYIKKKFIKGIAFPTSISVNEVCGNFAPLSESSEDPHEYKTLSEGDVAKVSLGVEINGFAALAGHTVVVCDKKEKVKGNKADVILAAYNSIQAALRLMTKEHTNNDVTNAISKICTDYKVNPIEGVLSHRMKRDIIDGLETIINKSTPDQRVDERKFEHGDVFGLAVIVSTGEGKPKETTIKTSIYKRALETTYKLRTDSGRRLLSVVENNFYSFPFSFSSFDKEENIKLKQKIPNFKTTMKMGLSECVKNDLLHGYPVLTEKKGEVVAEFTYTIAVRNEGPIVISGLTLDVNDFESDKKVTDKELNKELAKDLDTYLPNYKRTKEP